MIEPARRLPMTPTAATLTPQEADLQAFLAPLAPATALRLRTLAHAWTLAGGALAVGKHSIRLLGAATPPFTAATLHARGGTAALELSRVLLQAHGLDPEAWRDWCDERAGLRAHGFLDQAKFPAVRLEALPDADLARLALGLRDLGLLVAKASPASA
jgi:histidinol-phosphate/aromatic aminotransferase/cobyric acid decarboxylase-like protein